MQENTVAHAVIGAALEVHRALGPGLLESAYATCLRRELTIRKLMYESEVPISLEYKGCIVTEAYRADLLVENCVIVELKAIDAVCRAHKAQLLTYLRMTGRKLGLLVNFNAILLKDGIHRVAYGL